MTVANAVSVVVLMIVSVGFLVIMGQIAMAIMIHQRIGRTEREITDRFNQLADKLRK